MLFITSQWKFVLPQRCQISSSIWHILLLFNLFLNQAYLNCFWKRHGSFSFLWIKGMQCFTLFYLFFMAQAVPEDLSWTCTEVDLISASSHNCLFASVIFGEFWFNWEYIRLLQSHYFFCHCAVSAKDKSGSKSKKRRKWENEKNIGAQLYQRSTSNWRLGVGLSLHGSVADVPEGRPYVILV